MSNVGKLREWCEDHDIEMYYDEGLYPSYRLLKDSGYWVGLDEKFIDDEPFEYVLHVVKYKFKELEEENENDCKCDDK